ncbi:MAG TPA: hypothetical protein VJ183_08045 [Chloroflexia bacterium]|nr:hypothetical protein [Chloroflexia bacterium]
MPSAKTQKYLGYIGTVGVLTACFGCGLAANNQMRAANIFLITAWFILVPLFGYLISTRRHMKRVVRTRTAQRQAELDALATALREGSVGGGRGLGDVIDEGRKTKDEDSVTKEEE